MLFFVFSDFRVFVIRFSRPSLKRQRGQTFPSLTLQALKGQTIFQSFLTGLRWRSRLLRIRRRFRIVFRLDRAMNEHSFRAWVFGERFTSCQMTGSL